MSFDIKTVADLYELKKRRDLDRVHVDLTRLKYAGLAHHAIRLAFFAVREGGEIHLSDRHAVKMQQIGPFLMRWPTLRALAIRALGRDCTLAPDSPVGEMRFTRTTPVLGNGWSAGIIFSGQDQEIPALHKCLDGLLAQPELLQEDGEILICGPTRDMGFLQAYPMVRYVTFDLDDTPGPFPISRKKNTLMRAMKAPRRLVLHCRIVLEPGALSNAPAEFDLLGPNVIQRSDKGTEANVGYVTLDPRWPAMVPTRFERSTLNFAPSAYLDMLQDRRPYIDGAAFMVSERVLEHCMLDDGLLWGDCEDVEWCFRAQSQGFLVDMDPDVLALNVASKVRTLEWLPQPVSRGLRAARRVKRWSGNLIERLSH